MHMLMHMTYTVSLYMQERRGTSASGAPSGAARARRLQARVAISSSAQKLSHLARTYYTVPICGSHLPYI